MIVVDTNTLIYLWVPSTRRPAIESLFKADPEWLAPPLWRSEFRSALASYLRGGLLSIDQVLLIMRKAEELMENHERAVKSASVFHLVQESECSAYDCEFVALAMETETVLITHDKKILREFPGMSMTSEDFLSKHSS